MSPIAPVLALWLCGSSLLAAGFRQDGGAGSEPAAPGEASFPSGLVLSVRQGDSVDQRPARLAALRVAAGEAPTPFLAPGPFEARFEGLLDLRLRSRLRFRAQGRGTLVLKIGGETLLEVEGEDLSQVETEELRIGKGANPLSIEYRSPNEGDAWFRLEWAGRRFEWEPVQVESLRQGPAGQTAEFQHAHQLRLGRQLLADRQCLSCHDAGVDRRALATTGMPELATEAPRLDGAGWRLQPEWMLRWIRDPQALRPSARMPRIPGVVAGPDDEDDRTLRDVVAYLRTLRAEGPTEAWVEAEESLEREGGGLFADLGCIACHLLPGAGTLDDSGHDRLPLFEVGAKWTPEGLREFLRQPHRDAPWVRMPDFGLSPLEATALTAFLLAECRKAGTRPMEVSLGDAEAGQEAFARLGCVDCHPAPGASQLARPPALFSLDPAAPASAALDQGCLAEAGSAPRYRFDAAQRAALRAFLQAGPDSLHRRSPQEFARRQVAELQCSSCHTYDGEHDRWAGLVVEAQHLELPHEGHVIDQSRPRLTWLGEKMHSPWVEGLLKGNLELEARPWLHARMPAFPARAELLSQGLAAQHGLGSSRPQPETVDAETMEIGARLITKDGFACVSCHGAGDRPTEERFEFQTPNLDLSHRRIRPEYFARWMFNPLRVEPSSKMPRYADDKGGSPFEEDYEGDIVRQYEAIRLYLSTLSPEPPGDPGPAREPESPDHGGR